MNRLTALLIAIALWAGIYLPGLGSTEFKGEEGRRVMPAVTMMEGGSWAVPEVGGKPFLRKPPLVQWCMVGTMKLVGKNTWGARLPSALAVLGCVMVMIVATRRWLIAEQSLLAAVIFMTQVAMIDKCRLAELEAVYTGISGIALVLWMSAWARERNDWHLWILPMAVNGLALLAKGPLHLLFFYAVVVATLVAQKQLRRLWSLQHLAGWIVMGVIVALWAVPYFREVSGSEAARVWNRQFVERVTGAEMDWVKWLLNIPNGIANHLPWILFVPLLWRKGGGLHPRAEALLRGGRWAVAGCFIVLLLIPGVLPRYVQPLTAPFSLLMAMALWDCPARVLKWWRHVATGLTVLLFIAALASPFIVAAAITKGGYAVNPLVAGLAVLGVFAFALLLMSQRKRLSEVMELSLWTGLIFAMVMVLYGTAAVPWMRLREGIRPFAKRIDAAVPEGAKFVAYSLEDYAPLLGTLFYLEKTPITYASDADHAPEGRALYLVRGKDDRKFRARFHVEGDPVASWQPEGEKTPSVVVWAEKMR